MLISDTTEHCTCLSVALCDHSLRGSTKILLAGAHTPVKGWESVQGSLDGQVTNLKAFHLAPFI